MLRKFYNFNRTNELKDKIKCLKCNIPHAATTKTWQINSNDRACRIFSNRMEKRIRISDFQVKKKKNYNNFILYLLTPISFLEMSYVPTLHMQQKQ